jgi:DNA-binding NtrC family response regulator
MPISVLLVDDEENFVATLAKRLRIRRFEVVTASSGAAALAALEVRPVDVVVLDVRMPDLDGIAATKIIKARHPVTEVILLTGHASLEASMEGLTMGAFDYLLKPIDIDELVFKIEDAYRKKELEDQTSGHQNDQHDISGEH